MLGFRSYPDIQEGRIYTWHKAPLRTPFPLSFAIDAGFMAGQPNVTPASARSAVLSALSSWRVASHSFITFWEAPWHAVPNSGAAPPLQWEGPGFDQWWPDYQLPASEQQFSGWRAGWGANIEVFSRPTGFSMVSGTQSFVMGPGNLAFSVINRGGNSILSVDIYLNQDFAWRTDASTQGFDVQTVLLHEIGHALGLDHPEDAVAYGSVNLSPDTFLPGYQWSSADVMHPEYTGVKRSTTHDECGGLRYLYPSASALAADVNGDGAVDSSDLSLLLGLWGTNNPAADINADGVVNSSDLALLLGGWSDSVGP